MRQHIGEKHTEKLAPKKSAELDHLTSYGGYIGGLIIGVIIWGIIDAVAVASGIQLVVLFGSLFVYTLVVSMLICRGIEDRKYGGEIEFFIGMQGFIVGYIQYRIYKIDHSAPRFATTVFVGIALEMLFAFVIALI